MNKIRFQTDLIRWFNRHKRDLPWRQTKDPYKIWVSEIMLQQTHVSTVIPYYQRWIKEFPTPKAVAQASEEKILKAWEGLGYYSRTRNFQNACREVIEKYNGKVPDTPEEIQKIPGVGRYTAGAILSIAYDQSVPLVDGNVIRVLSRIFAIRKNPKTNVETFWKLAESLVPKEHAGDFNQALMELGATLCTPVNPSCLICPVQNFCQAKKQGIQDQLPVSSKRAKTQIVHLASALIHQNGKILLCQRKETGHLKGMWEPPTFPVQKEDNFQEKLVDFLQKNGFKTVVSENSVSLQTSRLHFRLQFQLFQVKLMNQVNPPFPIFHFPFSIFHKQLGYPSDLRHSQWVSKEKLKNLPMPGIWAKFFIRH